MWGPFVTMCLTVPRSVASPSWPFRPYLGDAPQSEQQERQTAQFRWSCGEHRGVLCVPQLLVMTPQWRATRSSNKDATRAGTKWFSHWRRVCGECAFRPISLSTPLRPSNAPSGHLESSYKNMFFEVGPLMAFMFTSRVSPPPPLAPSSCSLGTLPRGRGFWVPFVILADLT